MLETTHLTTKYETSQMMVVDAEHGQDVAQGGIPNTSSGFLL